RLAGSDPLGLPAVGQDLSPRGRLGGASTRPRQSEGGPHQGEERPAGDGVGPLRGVVGELLAQPLLELLAVEQFLKATPVAAPCGLFSVQGHPLLPQRWQNEQLVVTYGGRMLYS